MEHVKDRPRTGWPPGLLQDDSKKLSQWFANRPGAREVARNVAKEIQHGTQSQNPPGLGSDEPH